MLEGKTSLKGRRQGNDSPVSVELRKVEKEEEGKQREEIVQILLSSWHDLFISFPLN